MRHRWKFSLGVEQRRTGQRKKTEEAKKEGQRPEPELALETKVLLIMGKYDIQFKNCLALKMSALNQANVQVLQQRSLPMELKINPSNQERLKSSQVREDGAMLLGS